MHLTRLPKHFTFRGFEYWKDGPLYKCRQLSTGSISEFGEALLIDLLNGYTNKRNIPQRLFDEDLEHILSEEAQKD